MNVSRCSIALVITLAAAVPLFASNDAVLATVNEDPITGSDMISLFNNRHAGHAKFLGGEVEARKFLKIMIEDRLLIQEAYSLGIHEEKEVREYIDDFTRKEISKYFVSSEIDAQAKVSPEEVQEVWEKWLTSFFHGHHVVVATRGEAEEVRRAILAGTGVEELAKSCSVGPTAKRGGAFMAGWGQFTPTWEAEVFQLDAGDVSPVIENGDLFEVVVVSNRVEVPRPELKEVSKAIEDALFRRKLEARKREVSRQLWAKYEAKIRGGELSLALLQQLLERAPSTPLATWKGGQLTVREIFTADDLKQLATLPAGEAQKKIAEQIRLTVNAPLVALEAKERKMDEVPAVAAAIERYSDYMVEAVLFRDHIFRELKVDNAELEKFYGEHLADLEMPEQRRLAQILVATEADAAKVRKLATAKDSDFAALAKEHSRDMVSAASDGELGWVTADQVPQGYEEVFALPAGGVTKPLKSSAGWHLFKVLEVKPKATPAFAEVKEKVREKAVDAKKKEARAFWVDKLRAASAIEIDDAAIAAFVKANESTAPPPQHGMQ